MAIFSSIAAGISGLLAGTFLASGVGAFILQAAVGVGLNLLASSLAGQPEKTPFAIQGQLQSGGDVPRSFPIGYTATAGSLVYANTWGGGDKTPNGYFTQVIALADLPGCALVGLWVNGEKVTIDWSEEYEPGHPILEYQTEEAGNTLWIKFYDGTQTVADPFLVSTVSSPNRPYEETRVGVGVAYAVITAQINEELFTGFPSFKFELNGCKLYDPSKDSSVGGDGPQRWSNPSTWGGDGDHLPAVQLYNILRGLTFQGDCFYGLQNMSAARLPVSAWIAAIAKCRATIKGAGGALEPKFRCGGEIQVGAQISEAVQAILTSAQARLSEAGGEYTMHIGVSDASTFTITDGDILSTEEQSFTPFFGLADTINGIVATYPSPAEGWNAKPAPPRYSPAFEVEDGGRRLLSDVSLDFVPYKAQVQRLTKSALAEARRARRHTFVLPPKFWLLVPGDFVTWTSVRNGYEAKKFRIDGVIDRENLDVVVDMTEVDPSDYDWEQDTDFRVEPDGKIDRSKPAPQPIVDWYAEPAAIVDGSGMPRRPAIRLTWDNSAGQLIDVSGVRFVVRLKATEAEVYRGSTDQPSAGSILISQNLLPDVAYQARGKLVPVSDRKTTWSDWLDVTTPEILLAETDILDGAIVAAKIADAAITAAKLMDEAVTELKIADRAISTVKVQLDAIKTELVDNAAIVQSKIASGAVGDAQLAALAVTAAKLANNAVTETKIADGSITTPKLVANAVVADKIAAGAILTSKLVVANLENAFAGSEDPATTGWEIVPGNGGVFSTTVTYNGKPSSLAMNGTTGSGTTFTFPAFLGVSEGERYYVSFMMRRSSTWDGTGANSKLRFGDKDGAYVTALTYDSGAGAANTWVLRELQFVVPAGVNRLKPTLASDATAGTVHLSDFVFRKMASSELIVDGAIIADKLATNSVTASKIVAGSVTATELASNSVTSVKIAAEAVTTAKLAASSVTSDKLVANSITARELVLTDFENVLLNGFFGSGTLDGWTNAAPSAISVQPGTARAPAPSPYIVRFTPTTTQDIMRTAEGVQCKGGDKFYVQYDYAGSGGSPGGSFAMRIYWTDADGNALSSNQINATIAYTGWNTASGEFTAPAGAVAIRRIEMLRQAGSTGDGSAYVANLLVRRMKNAELIVDGAIIADKIASNAITSAKIAAGAITASKISARVITADKLVLGDITYEEIQNNTISVAATAYTNSITNIDDGNGWAGIGSVTLNHGDTDCKVLLKGFATCGWNPNNMATQNPFVNMRLTDITGSTVVIQTYSTMSPQGTVMVFGVFNPPNGRNSTTFNCQIQVTSPTGVQVPFRNRYVEAVAYKR